jgi:hypothetical protein
MIFLDESGKRWRRVKRSATAITLVVALPVLAVVGASLAYRPQWGALPLVKQVAEVVLPSSTQAHNPRLAAPKLAPKTAGSGPGQTNQLVAYRPAGASSGAALGASFTTPASPVATPVATPTPAPPGGGNPVRNDFGQSHKPVK